MTRFTTPHAKETHQSSLGTSWLLSSHAACSDGGVLLPAPPSAPGILRRLGRPSTSQRDFSNCDVGPCTRAKTKRPFPPRRTLRCARLPDRSNPVAGSPFVSPTPAGSFWSPTRATKPSCAAAISGTSRSGVGPISKAVVSGRPTAQSRMCPNGGAQVFRAPWKTTSDFSFAGTKTVGPTCRTLESFRAFRIRRCRVR